LHPDHPAPRLRALARDAALRYRDASSVVPLPRFVLACGATLPASLHHCIKDHHADHLRPRSPVVCPAPDRLAYCYQRRPLPAEWSGLSVPHDAIVTVHLINARCTVRVLAVPGRPRLAEAFDTDPHCTVVSSRRSLDARRHWHVWD